MVELKLKSGDAKGNRSKGLLAVGLAAVLLWLVVFRDSGSELGDSMSESGASLVGTLAAVAQARDILAKGGMGNNSSVAWPNIPLEETLQHDPFAVSTYLTATSTPPPVAPPIEAPQEATAEATTRAETAQALQSLQQEELRMVFRDASGAVALLGSRFVREGDVINGIRVVEISAEGILLLPVAPEPDSLADDSAIH